MHLLEAVFASVSSDFICFHNENFQRFTRRLSDEISVEKLPVLHYRSAPISISNPTRYSKPLHNEQRVNKVD